MTHAPALLSLLQHVIRVADASPSADAALRCGAALVCASTGLRGGEPIAVASGSTAGRAAALGVPAVDDAPADGADATVLVAVPVMVRGAATHVLGFVTEHRPNLVTLAALGAVGTALGRAVERERAAAS